MEKKDMIFYEECIKQVDDYNSGGSKPNLTKEELDRFDRIAGEIMEEKVKNGLK